WVSDQGAHFKNQVIARLQSALGAHHHFTLAYTPWANGTVEVVNREVLKSVKALLSERKLQATYWPRVLSVVQAALNSMPSDRLGGATPLTAFTALPGESQLRSILHPQDPLEASVTWVEAEITTHLQTVRAALDGMHAEMTSVSEKRRRAARDRHAKKRGVTLPKFSEGNFVLAATATGRSGNKFALVWRGPKRIVGIVNDYTFEVQDLMAPFATSLRHASQLQLYRDANRDLEESLVEQAIHGEGGHLVEALRSIRLSPDTHRWEILIKCGDVDFIFGTKAEAWFESCDIEPVGPGYITANGRLNESNPSFYVLNNARVFGSSGNATVYLGRPWRPYSRVVWQNSELSDVIHPDGWLQWHKDNNTANVYYKEFNNRGPGAATDKRVSFSGVLDAAVPITRILGDNYTSEWYIDTKFL
ncbi:hypothetical protein PR001_g27632, partial [Phytophthora rubi]